MSKTCLGKDRKSENNSHTSYAINLKMQEIVFDVSNIYAGCIKKRSFQLRKNYFCMLNIESPIAHQSSITFF